MMAYRIGPRGGVQRLARGGKWYRVPKDDVPLFEMQKLKAVRFISAKQFLAKRHKSLKPLSQLTIRRRETLSTLLSDLAQTFQGTRHPHFSMHNRLRILLNQIGALDLYRNCLQDALTWFAVPPSAKSAAKDESFWTIPPSWSLVPGVGKLVPRILGHAQDCLVRKITDPQIANRAAAIRIEGAMDKPKKGQTGTIYRAFLDRVRKEIHAFVLSRRSHDLLNALFHDTTMSVPADWRSNFDMKLFEKVGEYPDLHPTAAVKLFQMILSKFIRTILEHHPSLANSINSVVRSNTETEQESHILKLDTDQLDKWLRSQPIESQRTIAKRLWYSISDLSRFIADNSDAFDRIYDTYLFFSPI